MWSTYRDRFWLCLPFPLNSISVWWRSLPERPALQVRFFYGHALSFKTVHLNLVWLRTVVYHFLFPRVPDWETWMWLLGVSSGFREEATSSPGERGASFLKLFSQKLDDDVMSFTVSFFLVILKGLYHFLIYLLQSIVNLLSREILTREMHLKENFQLWVTATARKRTIMEHSCQRGHRKVDLHQDNSLFKALATSIVIKIKLLSQMVIVKAKLLPITQVISVRKTSPAALQKSTDLFFTQATLHF